MKNPIVNLLCTGQEYSVALRIADSLRERRIDCRAVDVSMVGSLSNVLKDSKVVLLCGSASWPFDARITRQLGALPAAKRRSLRIFMTAPAPVPQKLGGIPKINAALLGPDRGMSELLKFILDPAPGIDLVCVASQMARVTGVGWWQPDEVIVADEYYGHVIRIRKEVQTTLLLVGLDEPYHVHLDRQILIATDLGAHEVLTGKLVLGALTDVVAIPGAQGKDFRRPHGVFQGAGWSVIADSDNQRILWKRQHMHDFSEPFSTVRLPRREKFCFPNGVCADPQQIWVADTWNRRVVRLRPHTRERPQFFPLPGPHTPYPVAVLSEDGYLLVSDEANAAVRVFRIDDKRNKLTLLVHSLMPDYVLSPLGLSVNRAGRLAVADRSRGVVWTGVLADLIETRIEAER